MLILSPLLLLLYTAYTLNGKRLPLSLAILNWHVVHVGKILCTLHTSIMGNTILGNRNLGCRSSVVTEVHQLHFQQMQPLVFFTKASERYWLGISSCHMHLCFTCTICTDLTELPLYLVHCNLCVFPV